MPELARTIRITRLGYSRGGRHETFSLEIDGEPFPYEVLSPVDVEVEGGPPKVQLTLPAERIELVNTLTNGGA